MQTLQVFDTEKEAICMANDGEYGLSALVWSLDIDRPIRVARKLQDGLVSINSWANLAIPDNLATWRTAVASKPTSCRCIFALWALVLGFPSVGAAQVSPEAEVKAVVERFLEAVGRQDLEALPAMFAPGASIASAALRQGRWVSRSQSFEVWLAALRAAPRGAPYQEPVSEFTVHIDEGHLAFVRADAYVLREGQRRSHNIDYFTLLRDNEGNWKFVNGSYTTRPVQLQ